MSYRIPRPLIPLSTQTASTSASLSFTSVINSNFSTYYCSIRNLLMDTNNVTMSVTFSTNNGSTYLSTNYEYVNYVNTTGTSSTPNSTSAASLQLAAALSNAAKSGLNMDLYFFNLNSGTYSAICNGQGCHFNQASAYAITMVCGANSGTTAVNALKFAPSSGNFASGTIRLYGVVEP